MNTLIINDIFFVLATKIEILIAFPVQKGSKSLVGCTFKRLG